MDTLADSINDLKLDDETAKSIAIEVERLTISLKSTKISKPKKTGNSEYLQIVCQDTKKLYQELSSKDRSKYKDSDIRRKILRISDVMSKKKKSTEETKFRKEISKHTKKRKFTNLSNREIHNILETHQLWLLQDLMDEHHHVGFQWLNMSLI